MAKPKRSKKAKKARRAQRARAGNVRKGRFGRAAGEHSAPKTIDLHAELDALGPVADYAEGRIAWWRARCAIIDRHRRRGDPVVQQERHSPTVEIAVDDPEATRKARRNLTRVRQSEAWRHNQLTGMQRDAEQEMELAWRAHTGGMKAAVSKYSPLGAKGDGGIEMALEIEQAWTKWRKRAKLWSVAPADQRHIVPAVVIDCLSSPKTLADIERDHRLKTGDAMACYARGLDLWCELRGWSNNRGVIVKETTAIRTWVAQ
jgi:hypothetical protein